MALAQLVYISRRSNDLSLPVLKQVVALSHRNNADADITGVLMVCGNNLMQLLEGELASVASLFERIRQDSRHTDVRCLLMKNVARRLYPEWGMGLLDLENRVRLDGDRMLQLVEDLRANHDTARHSAEARLLLHDFRAQLGRAA